MVQVYEARVAGDARPPVAREGIQEISVKLDDVDLKGIGCAVCAN